MSTVVTWFHEQYATFFVFRSKNFSFHISISGGRTNEREVSMVPTRCLNSMQQFLFFGSKTISSIPRFLEVTQMKGRCQRYQRDALNNMRQFSFFTPKIFFCDISISGDRTGKREVSTVPMRYLEK